MPWLHSLLLPLLGVLLFLALIAGAELGYRAAARMSHRQHAGPERPGSDQDYLR
ncbi:hypothetical protein [Sphingomonas sp. dw_22]|uniref:hypothetical protein n=1 Tax=Sphingomonas sp. dw_22 TaxID=2721175 RepID=UPI001BD5DC3C|nr:hypothetical protein [Sphingomonas sp. dw_22]